MKKLLIGLIAGLCLAAGLVTAQQFSGGGAFPSVANIQNVGLVTNSLSGDVSLSNTGSFFDGPSVANGTSGTWFASGTVLVSDSAGAAFIACKLWDATTVIASLEVKVDAANSERAVSLSGALANPAANIRISCRDVSSTSGKIGFNASGASKDATLTAYRIN